MPTKTELSALMGDLTAAYPNANVSAATIRVYESDLSDLPIDILRAAAKKHRLTSKWFPTVAELREAVVSITTAEKRSGLEAWGDVRAAIAAHGIYHPPDGAQYLGFQNDEWTFDDPLVGYAVKALGWPYLCQSEDEMVDRAHFVKAYEQARDRQYAELRLTPDVVALQDDKRGQALQITAGVANKLIKR